MFGWFRPVCPCDAAAKPWVESRLRWLTGQFGLHVLLERPIILPTSEFFPDAWDASPKAAKRLFRRVCEYMDVDAELVKLRFVESPGGRAQGLFGESVAAATWSHGDGPWQKAVVTVDPGGLERPADLVGYMAHELAHQRLMGEGRVTGEEFDNELLTDLTATFFGFGIFLANNPRKSTGTLDKWPGTQLHRPEYLSEPMLGYALAHVAWFRDEPRPAWAKHLRWAQRAVFNQGLNYLQRTNDSRFQPVRLRGAQTEDPSP
jgi:hypothetical protein